MEKREAQGKLTDEDKEILERLHKEMEVHGVAHTIAVAGQSFVISAFGSNFGQMFIILDDFQDRRGPKLHSDEIAANPKKSRRKNVPRLHRRRLRPASDQRPGHVRRFKYMLEDRGDSGLQELINKPTT